MTDPMPHECVTCLAQDGVQFTGKLSTIAKMQGMDNYAGPHMKEIFALRWFRLHSNGHWAVTAEPVSWRREEAA